MNGIFLNYVSSKKNPNYDFHSLIVLIDYDSLQNLVEAPASLDLKTRTCTEILSAKYENISL